MSLSKQKAIGQILIDDQNAVELRGDGIWYPIYGAEIYAKILNSLDLVENVDSIAPDRVKWIMEYGRRVIRGRQSECFLDQSKREPNRVY